MPLLISTFARYSPHEVNFVFQFFIDFLINCTIFSETCINSRFFKIQDGKSYHKLSHNQSMSFPDYCVSSCNHSAQFYILKVDLLSFDCFFFFFFCSTGSKLYISKYSYTLLAIIPVISFHMRGSHEIG